MPLQATRRHPRKPNSRRHPPVSPKAISAPTRTPSPHKVRQAALTAQPPRLTPRKKRDTSRSPKCRLSYCQIRSNVVLVGDPGAGKTALCRWRSAPRRARRSTRRCSSTCPTSSSRCMAAPSVRLRPTAEQVRGFFRLSVQRMRDISSAVHAGHVVYNRFSYRSSLQHRSRFS